MKKLLKERYLSNDSSAAKPIEKMDPATQPHNAQQVLHHHPLPSSYPHVVVHDLPGNSGLVASYGSNYVGGNFPNVIPQQFLAVPCSVPCQWTGVENNLNSGTNCQAPTHPGTVAYQQQPSSTGPAPAPAPAQVQATAAQQGSPTLTKLQQLNMAVTAIIIMETNKLKANLCGVVYDLVR